MAGARKVVTVVFADVAGSTALGEAVDPEAARRVMDRFFAEARRALERHGGTVEKFIGDAVMAVFGIPLLHDDDALRAVRAATELREHLAVLNEELERDWGFRIAVRIGINTGEVVAGDEATGEPFATGDAVNVAARLEQAAGAGEILVGDPTRRLLQEAIRVDAVEPLPLKGKAERVPAWRLLEVLPDVPAFARELRAPFVGREAELAELEAALARATDEGACRLVSVVGPPGIGKSRLARELIAAVGTGARAVVGRCVPYGEGITYWPLAEIVDQLAGRGPAGIAELVAGDESAELIAERIAGAVGLTETEGRSEEIAWAVRKLLEALARERPVVVVLDDVHWAEPTFLDLIEYLAGFTTGPVLLLALARPDLLDERASWTVPRPNASTIFLEPLSEDEAEELIEKAGGVDFSESALRRIAEASEGNPLFVEQLLAFQAQDGGADDELVVPPTIQALLAARIDRLGPAERAVIERGSVEGRSFHRGAVSALLPDTARASLGGDLVALVRKELIHPDRAEFAGDDGYRFVHVLVQDAAYASMAKELRAELHDRYAGWLEAAASGRMGEYEEILGYHLEQAYRYRVELGPVDEDGRALARRAAEFLAAAANRAMTRGDWPAQANLLSRAIVILPVRDRKRLEFVADLGHAVAETGEFARAELVLGAGAEELLSEAIQTARDLGDACAEARARVARAAVQWHTGTSLGPELQDVAEGAIRVFEEAGDELGLARAWGLLGWVLFARGQSESAEKAFERTMEYARRVGSRRDELWVLARAAWATVWGLTHRETARERCERILERMEGDREGEADVLGALGCLAAIEGRFDEARARHAQRAATYEQLGLSEVAAWNSQETGWVEILAGNSERAERLLRHGYETFERMGAKGQQQPVGAYLAQAVYLQGRYEEAERVALVSEQLDPSVTGVVTVARCARAKAAARLGRVREGERLAREAVSLIDGTDFLIDRADARMDLAEVLLVEGRSDEAAELLEQALHLHEQKGNLVSAERARALLAELGR